MFTASSFCLLILLYEINVSLFLWLGRRIIDVPIKCREVSKFLQTHVKIFITNDFQ